MKMVADQPTTRLLKRRPRPLSPRRKSSEHHRPSRLTPSFSTIISASSRSRTRWADARSKRPKQRQRRRLLSRKGLSRSSSRTMRFARLLLYRSCCRTSCTTPRTWSGSTCLTTIWSRLNRTCLTSRSSRHYTSMAITSLTWMRPRSWMASVICKVWPSTETLSRQSPTIASGCSVSCTPTPKTCVAWIRCSWRTASSTKYWSGRREFSLESTSVWNSLNLLWWDQCPHCPKAKRRRRSRTTSDHYELC